MNAYVPPLVTLLWLIDIAACLTLILGAGIAGLFLFRAIERHREPERNPHGEECADSVPGVRA